MGHFLAAKTLTFKKKAKSKTFLVKMSFTCVRINKPFSYQTERLFT